MEEPKRQIWLLKIMGSASGASLTALTRSKEFALMSTDAFPAIGQIYEANFGMMAFHLKFDSDGKTMRYKLADAPDFTAAPAVTYTAVLIRSGVFMVYWTEADKTTVTHVEDFEKGQVHTNITRPDHSFLNLSGTLKHLA